MKPLRDVVLTYLLVGFLIALKNPSPLVRGAFWAEDASEFFFESLINGFTNIFKPMWGYHYFCSRVIAWICSFFDVYAIPYLYAWSCGLINAFAFAYFVRDGFSWLVKNRYDRMLIALILAIGPGTPEVFYNLANLPQTLAFLGLLLILEKPHVLSWKTLLVFFFLAVSCGQMILWIPLLVYLGFTEKEPKYGVLVAIIGAVGVVNYIGSHNASLQSGTFNANAVWLIPKIMAENAFDRLLPGPFLGDIGTGQIMLLPRIQYWAIWSIGVAAVAGWMIRSRRSEDGALYALGIAYLGTMAGVGMTVLSRGYALKLLVRASGTLVWYNHYSFLPGAIALLIWFSIVTRAWYSSSRWVRVLAQVGFTLLVGQVAVTWRVNWSRPDQHWSEKVSKVRSIIDRSSATNVLLFKDLPILPVGWIPSNGRMSVTLPPRP